MGSKTQNDYDALAAWAESDAPRVRPDAVIERGSDAGHAEVAAMLRDAAESPAEVAEVERAIERTAGRPSLAATSPKGTSPLWQVRAPEHLDAALRARAHAEGRSFSAVLRDAATEYLTRHAS